MIVGVGCNNLGLRLGVVARRDKEVCEDGQLVVGEFGLVVLPVVLVGALEVLKSFLKCHLQ